MMDKAKDGMNKSSLGVGVLIGLLAALIIAAVLPVSGVFSMTATQEPGLLDSVGATMKRRSVSWRASDANIPVTADAHVGFEHFKSSCVQCHGASGVDRAEWAQTMLPMAPDLSSDDVQAYSDGELFYIVKHGIRMTGMPAFGPGHSDGDIWNIVALLRELDALTPDQQSQLQEAVGSSSHSHSHGQHHGENGSSGQGHGDAPSGSNDSDAPSASESQATSPPSADLERGHHDHGDHAH